MPAKSKSSSSSKPDNATASDANNNAKKPGTEVDAPVPEVKRPAPLPKPPTLDLLAEKPKRKRGETPVSPAEPTPEDTAASADTAAPAEVPPPAPVPVVLSALDEQKQGALSLFDEKERKAEQRKKRAEDLASGVTTAAAPKNSILTPISRRRADQEAKQKQEAAELASLFEQKSAKSEPTAPVTDLASILNPEPSPETSTEPTVSVGGAGSSSATAHVPAATGDGDDEHSNIINLKPPIIVKELAERMKLKPFKLVAELMEMDIFVNQSQPIEPEVAAKLCEKHGFIFERERREKGAGIHKEEKVIAAPLPPLEIVEEEMKARPPIITIMGHVDHGKTSLLDSIRKARVAAGEAGGITQHIGAYTVEHNGQNITFLDTPGHAAFTAMRARGANLTDIVILVVAADDGLMPQTIESIAHAKAAGVVIVVAMNKMDLLSANPDRLMGQLQEQGLSPEAWGGTTAVMPVSALKGTGIEELLEHTLLEAELLELKGNPTAPCRAVVVESRFEAGRGPTATVIPRIGTLKVGASFICGPYFGKVKNMVSDSGKPVQFAGPATPVEVLGFSDLPNVGDELVVMPHMEAKKLSEQRQEDRRTEKLMTPRRTTLENIFKQMAEGEKKEMRLILKTDVQGSMEAIVGQLKEIKSNKIDLVILHSAVGPITESDILLASASQAVVVGFATKVEAKAVKVAKSEGVDIKLYSIIYELFDQVKDAMKGMLDPETRQKVSGHAVVKQIFKIQKGRVAGCAVTDGRLLRTGYARVLRGREKVPVYDGKFHTLRRYTDEVPEVRNGLECGVRLGDFDEYEEGDVIECYELEKLPQTL